MPGLWNIISSTARSDPAGREDFAVTVAGRTLAVRVRRHAAARLLRLRYDVARGELRLTLPKRGRIAEARRWVDQQSGWIAAQLTRIGGPAPVGPGTSLPWNGGALPIAWDSAHPRRPAIVDGALRVGGPAESVAPRIRRWLVEHARAEFTERSQAMAAAESLPLTGVSVADPRSRWGSCTSAGQIRYSWRLVMAPDFVRHAIVAHEVAHLAHLNHGPQFHALNRRLGGDAVDRSRAWLNAHGPMLHALRFDPA
jgi:hypothetical protein